MDIRSVLRASLVGALLFGGTPPHAQEPPYHQESRPVEIGQVRWSRDWADALKESRTSGRPIAVLFQEIPGCQTCQDYGTVVLGHPLLVEAFEDCFVPLLVYNNRPGRDEAILKRFQEPAWNNPVVRYVNAEGEDLIARMDRIWDPSRTAGRMIETLQSIDKAIPRYLEFLASTSDSSQSATFAMHCFWEGEALLGHLRGVTSTTAAWIGPHEVVHVTYDAARISFPELLREAKRLDCTSRVYAHDLQQYEVAHQDPHLTVQLLSNAPPSRDAKAADQLYYLRQTSAAWLPLTSYQATKINAAIAAKQDFAAWLSPRQLELHARLSELLSRDSQALAPLEPLPSANELSEYARSLVRHIAARDEPG